MKAAYEAFEDRWRSTISRLKPAHRQRLRKFREKVDESYWAYIKATIRRPPRPNDLQLAEFLLQRTIEIAEREIVFACLDS